MHKTPKKSYAAPAVKKHGELRALTLGNADGDFTDALFPPKTPKDELTFSDLT